MKLHWCKRQVDVLEEGLSGDTSYAGRGLDEVIAGLAGLFAAESVGKNEGFGKLTSAHQKTSAVDGPLAFKIHNAFFHPTRLVFLVLTDARLSLGGYVSQVERLYAQTEGRVNYIRIVQRWNSRSLA